MANVPTPAMVSTDEDQMSCRTSSQAGFVTRQRRAERAHITVDGDLFQGLVLFSEKEGVTTLVAAFAAFHVLLWRLASQDDVSVAFMVAEGEDDERHVSARTGRVMFGGAVLAGDPAFRNFVQRVREGLHHGSSQVPATRTEPEQPSLADLQPRAIFCAHAIGEFRANTPAYLSIEDLRLDAVSLNDALVATLTYDVEVFDRGAIERTCAYFETMLHSIVADPDQQVSKLRLLTQEDRRRLLVDWNNTARDYPRACCIHQLVEAQVAHTPSSIAVVFGTEAVTYEELNRRANQLAHYLIAAEVTPDTLVGVLVERSVDMIVALLGVLKAGGAYVPLDPAYPNDRLSFMLNDADVKVLVTHDQFVGKISAGKRRIISLDSKRDELAEQRVDNPVCSVQPLDLAYVIYTSGSTGKPKGVQIPHKAVVNFLNSMRESPGMSEEDRLLAVTTLSFDIAVLELFLPLTVGASVEIASREIAVDGKRLLSLLRTSGATVLQATPATWRLLLEAGWQGSRTLKILCGGEAMPRELASELLKRGGSVWNMYGPTETTVWSTICQLMSGCGAVDIGRPIANTEIYILDGNLDPAPIGVAGELYIGGDGLSRGYLNRPELTESKFVSHPFKQSGARLFRTGDLARYRDNGSIECLGRIDHQVKVRGFRIELGEIESILAEQSAIKQNVVVAREDTPLDKRLVAYLVPRPGQQISAETLRGFVRSRVPEYMVPSHFVFLDSLPLTPNGKVDRKALPKPELPLRSVDQDRSTPSDEIERELSHIWESVLGLHGVGANESFFDLGGHSLLVAKLLSRIERSFGRSLSMAAVFEAPTIAQQASLLRKATSRAWPSTIVPVQPGGSRPPLFCFGFNAGPMFLPLARRLGADQPLLGVDPTLLDPISTARPYNMEAVVACIIDHIREVQPAGPYFLGGFCAGGLMAFETARQLSAQGNSIGLLALFEPQTPASYDHNSERPHLHILAQRVAFHLRNLKHFGLKESRTFTLFRARNMVRRVQYYFGQASLRSRTDKHALGMTEILDIAYRTYRPGPFPGNTLLFQASDRPVDHASDQQFWRSLSPHIKVHEFSGDWNWVVRLFLEPQVDILAHILQDSLNCEYQNR